MKTISEIKHEIAEFIKERDKRISKVRGVRKYRPTDYLAVHMKSDDYDAPICHIRPVAPDYSDGKKKRVTCYYCLRIMKKWVL